MANIVRRQQQAAALVPDQVLSAQVADAERVGIASVARLQAGAYVTSVALQNATMLSRAANTAGSFATGVRSTQAATHRS